MRGLIAPCLALSALVLLAPLPGVAAPSTAYLGGGGYVIVIRTAHGLEDAPVAGTDRPLDAAGLRQADVLRQAIRAGRINIRRVYASPALSAKQTVRQMGLRPPAIRKELGEGAQGVIVKVSTRASAKSKAEAWAKAAARSVAWLRNAVAQTPPAGTDTLIVTQDSNIVTAFGGAVRDMADGEALVFRPNGAGEGALTARVKLEDWNLTEAPPPPSKTPLLRRFLH